VKCQCLPKPGRRLEMTIFIDDEPWADIHRKIFGWNFSLPVSETMEKFREQFIVLEYAKAKKYALDRLAMRSYPSTQLKKLLEKNLVSAETIQKLLHDFTKLGFLNDNEWVERFVKAQLARHVGPQKIVAKLMCKGIPQKEAVHSVENFSDPMEAQKSLRHLLSTKYKNRNLADFRERQKLFAALAIKGFDSQTIQSALSLDFHDSD
jgi:regulatory protein